MVRIPMLTREDRLCFKKFCQMVIFVITINKLIENTIFVIKWKLVKTAIGLLSFEAINQGAKSVQRICISVNKISSFYWNSLY
jgi:hypothetical protein